MVHAQGCYDYLPITRRPGYDWPGGARVAVYLSIVQEHSVSDEPGTPAAVGPLGNTDGAASYDYGNRVGAWRVLDLLYELALPATVPVETTVLDFCPELIRAHLMRGDEVTGYAGGPSKHQLTPSEEEESALIAETTGKLAAFAGARPAGWLVLGAPESRLTPDLLAEAGYEYLLGSCCDDQPIWMRTRRGRILALPYAPDLDDVNMIAGAKIGADAFADMIVDDFDERLHQSESGPLVMGLLLHPRII
ncbi:MAG: polysaccharide deacetylase, partial [Rhodospirillales bacterium]|nr:polysaccharide deacetylase [Rhodospirillales bacterium]